MVVGGMSITDELRNYAHKYAWDGAETYDQHLLYIADQIEEEMANYVELPKDADGEPWHIGDMTGRGRVTALHLVHDDWFIETESEQWELADSIGHAKPDSWERIIEDAAATRGDFDELVARCKSATARS